MHTCEYNSNILRFCQHCFNSIDFSVKSYAGLLIFLCSYFVSLASLHDHTTVQFSIGPSKQNRKQRIKNRFHCFHFEFLSRCSVSDVRVSGCSLILRSTE